MRQEVPLPRLTSDACLWRNPSQRHLRTNPLSHRASGGHVRSRITGAQGRQQTAEPLLRKVITEAQPAWRSLQHKEVGRQVKK